MKIMTKALLTVGVALCLCASASAQTISVGNAAGSPGGATTPAVVPVVFTRNDAAGSIPVADYIARVSYNTTNLNATVAGVNGGGCTVDDAAGVVTSVPLAGSTNLPSNTFCEITFTIAGAAPAPSTQTLTLSFAPGGSCLNASADPVNCTLTNGAITVTAPASNTLSVVSGSGQSATVSTAFTAPLVAQVATSGGAPVAGATVNFVAPAGAVPSATLSQPSCTTAANGQCSVTATANATVGGPYNVAATSGALGPVNFVLTNTAVAPNVLTVVSGTPQSATVSTQFALPLVAQVATSGGAPVAGATVNFVAPAGAVPSATLSQPSCTTAANGQCSVTATANATVGGPYNVAATSGALGPVNFVLTNTAAVVNTPPTVNTFPPASNPAFGSQFIIGLGCPTDGSPCTGSGTGLDATTRLEQLSAVYNGPPASPTPTMVCSFVNESAGAVGSTLDFVALTADPGDIRCTCPASSTNDPTEAYQVRFQQRSPASSGTTTLRTVNVTCGPPPVCGTFNLTAGNLNLVPGADPANVVAASLTGATANVSRTVSCSIDTMLPAGVTFSVTTSPTPLTVSTTPSVSGNVLAACTNTTDTTQTATMTCTNSSNVNGCASQPSTFTLSCPGRAAPPLPNNFVPVPALNEQGRILLAALVLLMGLGVVGFRMRG